MRRWEQASLAGCRFTRGDSGRARGTGADAGRTRDAGRRSLLAVAAATRDQPALHRPLWALELAFAISYTRADRELGRGVVGRQAVIASLAGRPYQEVAGSLRIGSRSHRTPCRRDGSIWLATSRDELMADSRGQLSAPDLTALGQAAADVLVRQSALQMPRSERWMAGVHGFARRIRRIFVAAWLRLSSTSEDIS